MTTSLNSSASSGLSPIVISGTFPNTDVLSALGSNVTFDVLTRGWWKLNNSLADENSTNDFQSDSGDSAVYKRFRIYNLLLRQNESKYGLLFEENKTYSTSIDSLENSNNEYSMNLGFWYYSPEPLGFIRNVVTRQLTPVQSPIVAKCDFKFSDGKINVSPHAGEWIISEIAYSATQNAIKLTVCDNNSHPKDHFISEPYDTDKLHSVYINIKSNPSTGTSYFRIDIDGIFGTQHVKGGSALIMSNTVAKLRINDSVIDYLSHQKIQTNAYLSDLFIQNKGSIFATKTLLMSRFGVPLTLVSDTEYPAFNFFGIGYDQPTTITTNQILSEGGSLYVLRSNGEILKGHKPIWDKEFNFLNSLDISELNNTNADSSPQWSADGMVITKTTIKI